MLDRRLFSPSVRHLVKSNEHEIHTMQREECNDTDTHTCHTLGLSGLRNSQGIASLVSATAALVLHPIHADIVAEPIVYTAFFQLIRSLLSHLSHTEIEQRVQSFI
jgi:hypothetical protein